MRVLLLMCHLHKLSYIWIVLRIVVVFHPVKIHWFFYPTVDVAIALCFAHDFRNVCLFNNILCFVCSVLHSLTSTSSWKMTTLDLEKFYHDL